jgi:hypothetical protein
MELDPKEILVLHYANGVDVNQGLIQVFWKDTYQIDPNKTLKKLLKLELIKIDDNPLSILQQYRVPELKEILKNHNLKVSGRKNELIKRITESVSKEEIIHSEKSTYYTYTPEGKNIVDTTVYIMYFHQHPYFDISLKRVVDFHKSHPSFSSQEIALYFLTKKQSYDAKMHNLDSARSYDRTIFGILDESGKYQEAVEYLVQMIYFDLNFYIDPRIPRAYINDELFEHQSYRGNISRDNISKLISYIDDKEVITLDEFIKKVFDLYEHDTSEIKLFNFDEIKEIIISEYNNDADMVMEVYRNAKKRYTEFLQDETQDNYENDGTVDASNPYFSDNENERQKSNNDKDTAYAESTLTKTASNTANTKNGCIGCLVVIVVIILIIIIVNM